MKCIYCQVPFGEHLQGCPTKNSEFHDSVSDWSQGFRAGRSGVFIPVGEDERQGDSFTLGILIGKTVRSVINQVLLPVNESNSAQ